MGRFPKTQELFEQYFKRTTMINSNTLNDILLNIESQAGTKSFKMTTTAEGNSGFGRAIPVIIKGGSLKDNYAETYLPGYNSKIHVILRVSEAKYKDADENAKTPTPSPSTSMPGTNNPNTNQLNMPGSSDNPIQ